MPSDCVSSALVYRSTNDRIALISGNSFNKECCEKLVKKTDSFVEEKDGRVTDDCPSDGNTFCGTTDEPRQYEASNTTQKGNTRHLG